MAADHYHGNPIWKCMFEIGSISMKLQKAITKGTMLQIEALSESINNLTYLLSRDELQKEQRRSQMDGLKDNDLMLLAQQCCQ